MNSDQLRRFESKISRLPESGCWVWLGATDGGGYGGMKVDGRIEKAHRLSFSHFSGELTDGLEIDHLCRVRCCVNPHHLEQVTRSENLRRSPIIGKTRKDHKTHCKNGHPRTEGNTYINGKGHIYCKDCRAECEKNRRLKAKWG